MNAVNFLSPTQRKSYDWLSSQLASGEKAVSFLEREARRAKVPLRSLSRSRDLLGVVISQDEDTKKFFWSLPG